MPKSVESASDENSAPQAGDIFLIDLLPAFRRLDSLIQRAVIAAEATYGPGSFADFYRGLHMPPKEVEQLLARKPGAPTLYQEAGEGDSTWSEVLPIINSRFTWLRPLLLALDAAGNDV